MRYRHCLLRKGVTQQMAWIPEPFAKVGKYLRIGESDGWLVDAVYSAKPEEYILKHRNEYRNAFRKYCWEVAQVAERLTLNQQVASPSQPLLGRSQDGKAAGSDPAIECSNHSASARFYVPHSFNGQDRTLRTFRSQFDSVVGYQSALRPIGKGTALRRLGFRFDPGRSHHKRIYRALVAWISAIR